MAGENEQTQQGGTAQPAAVPPPAVATPPAPAADPPKPKPDEQAAKAGKAPAAEPPKEPKRAAIKGDDEIPEGVELLELSPSALSKRLDRYSKKQLKELFGTDDIEKIKEQQKELQGYRDKAEADRRAQLTKEQKLEEDVARERARADAAEMRVRQERQNREFETYDRAMMKVAQKYIDDEYVEGALVLAAKHLRQEFGDKKLDEMTVEQTQAEIDKFLADYVAKKPKYARDYDERTKAAAKKEMQQEARERAGGKKPVTNGAGDRPPPANANPNEPVIPGKLPKAEYEEYKRKNGIRY